MDFSICKDVTIKKEYELKDTSLLDIKQISDLKEKGIDAFDIKNNFLMIFVIHIQMRTQTQI